MERGRERLKEGVRLRERERKRVRGKMPRLLSRKSYFHVSAAFWGHLVSNETP